MSSARAFRLTASQPDTAVRSASGSRADRNCTARGRIADCALLRRIDQLITKETGVAAYVAEAPMACVAMGAGKALENYATIRRSIGGL